MATRIVPHMNSLMSNAQSAFNKKRIMHKNFLYVNKSSEWILPIQNLVPPLQPWHKENISLNSLWDYLFNLLWHCSFLTRFPDWVWALLSTSTPRVLLNRVPCDPMKHGRCFQQGGPLSPIFFVLATDQINPILNMVTLQGFLHPLPRRALMTRTSPYAMMHPCLWLRSKRIPLSCINACLLWRCYRFGC
jgi:hypothetical protein